MPIRGFQPKFRIANAITAALTRIERARGFLEAATQEPVSGLLITGDGRFARVGLLPAAPRLASDEAFKLRLVPLRAIRPEEWALIDLTLRLIAEYGALGGENRRRFAFAVTSGSGTSLFAFGLKKPSTKPVISRNLPAPATAISKNPVSHACWHRGLSVTRDAKHPQVRAPRVLAHAGAVGMRGGLECLTGWDRQKPVRTMCGSLWTPCSGSASREPINWSICPDGAWRRAGGAS